MVWIRTFAKSLIALSALAVGCGAAVAVMPPASPRMPFSFVENRGQSDSDVRFLGVGPEFKAWFQDGGVAFEAGDTSVRVAFVNAATPSIIGTDRIGGRANYLQGTDPARWKSDLPMFATLRYQGLWPGIELDYRAEEGRVKAEYRVAPGADAGVIRLRFEGVARILSDGTLRIHGESGDFIEDTPVVYQIINGVETDVVGSFRKFADGCIGFSIGDYDHAEALVIDPSILFSGYFGGTSQDNVTAVAMGPGGVAVVAGWTSSTTLPTVQGLRTKLGGTVDAFVAAFYPNGGALEYCTYLGGGGDDRAFGIIMDAAGNSYITGWTSSSNFPVVGALQSHLSGSRDAFVTKLSPSGNAIIFSTYLGGSGVDSGNAITLDTSNNPVIVGDTTSADLAVSGGAFQRTPGGGQDGFVAKLSAAGNALVSLTYLGGTLTDHAAAVRLDASNNVFVGGYTLSTNFPVQAAYQPFNAGNQDGFVAKFAPALTNLAFSTYLGGSGGTLAYPEQVNALFVDLFGNVAVAGTTSSPNFPVTAGAMQIVFGGQLDGFISRFSTQGMLLQSTYFGGGLSDQIYALAEDLHGYIYVTGSTYSPDLPVRNAFQPIIGGGMDAFVAKINTTLSGVIFSSFLGGSKNEAGNALALDAETSLIIGGQTTSPNFPSLGNLNRALTELNSGFVTKIAASYTLGIFIPSTGALSVDQWHVIGTGAATLLTQPAQQYTAPSARAGAQLEATQSGQRFHAERFASFGMAGDLPVTGDWDGSGVKRIGVFRNGSWLLDINGDGIWDSGDRNIPFGQTGDIPVVGDWLGTGRISLGLFRNGTFILDYTGHLSGIALGSADLQFAFGQPGDIPVVADWNSSGIAKVGVFRAGTWLVDYNGDHLFNGSDRTYTYGQAGDYPITGDWDSSGTPSKIGVFRSGLWILDYDGDNVWTTPFLNEMVLSFGSGGYLPLSL